jgi:4-hydroxy-4-methyl-2-oxoglutarate aldolase
MRNEGFANGSIRCFTPELPPMLGYAVTAQARTSFPPISGRYYHTNMDWWRYVAEIPQPRVLVIRDVDEKPGSGALAGELHAAIAGALGCVGMMTNGAIRDLPQLKKRGFHVFAGSLVVAHSYAHIGSFGEPVEVGGLVISPGDLLHGDLHGIHTIPLSIAPELTKTVRDVLHSERRFLRFCSSPEFSLDRLSEKLDEVFRDDISTAKPEKP